jgi:hypothetical protein
MPFAPKRRWFRLRAILVRPLTTREFDKSFERLLNPVFLVLGFAAIVQMSRMLWVILPAWGFDLYVVVSVVLALCGIITSGKAKRSADTDLPAPRS